MPTEQQLLELLVDVAVGREVEVVLQRQSHAHAAAHPPARGSARTRWHIIHAYARAAALSFVPAGCS